MWWSELSRVLPHRERLSVFGLLEGTPATPGQSLTGNVGSFLLLSVVVGWFSIFVMNELYTLRRHQSHGLFITLNRVTFLFIVGLHTLSSSSLLLLQPSSLSSSVLNLLNNGQHILPCQYYRIVLSPSFAFTTLAVFITD